MTHIKHIMFYSHLHGKLSEKIQKKATFALREDLFYKISYMLPSGRYSIRTIVAEITTTGSQ